ncbi:MAG: twin transmembrane helix small protein [Rhodobacterales bacterium]|nr:twin transmembrane helix small protein [Rhodobacterales bacterium]
MLKDPLFLLVALSVVVVLGILLFGIGTFGKGGAYNARNANKIMRYRIIAQFVAILVILLYVLVRRS